MMDPTESPYDGIDDDEYQRQLILLRQQNALYMKNRLKQQRQDEKASPNTSDDGTSAPSLDDLPPVPSVSSNMSSDISTPDSAAAKPKIKKLDPKLVGMSVGFKNLYSGKEDRHGRFQWQDKIPEDVLKPAEDAETQKWALIIRHVKVYNDPRKTLGIHSIVVQSPLLKKLLEGVLAGYPGVTVGLQRLEFSGRFEPLIHRFSELKAAIRELKATVGVEVNGHTDRGKGADAANWEDLSDSKATRIAHAEGEKQASADPLLVTAATDSENVDTNETAAGTKAEESNANATPTTDKDEDDSADNDALKLEHAQLLHDVLLGEFQTLLDSSQDMKAKAVVTYEYLWTIFQPGTMVYARQDGQERVFRLKSGKYGVDKNENPVFWCTVQFVDYDGNRFGYKVMNINVSGFSGTRPISSLSVFPLHFHSDQAQLRERLVARGSKVENFAGTHYKHYEGIGWKLDSFGEKERFSVKGRIIIDALGWNRYLSFPAPVYRDKLLTCYLDTIPTTRPLSLP